MSYELFYSDGGHGGPYYTLAEALNAAERLATINRSISVKRRIANGPGGYDNRSLYDISKSRKTGEVTVTLNLQDWL